MFAVIAKVAAVVATVATVGAVVSNIAGNQNLANIFGKIAMIAGIVSFVSGGISMAARSIAVQQASYNTFVNELVTRHYAESQITADALGDVPSYMAGDVTSPAQLGAVNETAETLSTTLNLSEKPATTIGAKLASVTNESASSSISTASRLARFKGYYDAVTYEASWVEKAAGAISDWVHNTDNIFVKGIDWVTGWPNLVRSFSADTPLYAKVPAIANYGISTLGPVAAKGAAKAIAVYGGAHAKNLVQVYRAIEFSQNVEKGSKWALRAHKALSFYKIFLK